MDLKKIDSTSISIVYLAAAVIAFVCNFYLIAEPVRWYHCLVTGSFILVKTLFCLSKENSRYSVWVTLVIFLVALYAGIVLTAGIENYYLFAFAELSYLATYLPYGGLSAFIANWNGWMFSVPIIDLIFFVIAFLTSRKANN